MHVHVLVETTKIYIKRKDLDLEINDNYVGIIRKVHVYRNVSILLAKFLE